jgi:hypothetical protein
MESQDRVEPTEDIAPWQGDDDAAREHWEQVIREEFVPVDQRVWCPSALEELDERRLRRRARRGLASVTRLAQVRRDRAVSVRRVVPGSEVA